MLAEVLDAPVSEPQALADAADAKPCRHDTASRRACGEAHDELSRLGAVQRLLLPEAPPRVPGLDIAVAYRPASHAGGDYYDFLPLQDGRWGILIADVSGDGREPQGMERRRVLLLLL